MKNNESNNQYQIYLKSTKRWIPVSEEFQNKYYRNINAFRRKQQRHKRCVCPKNKWWLCNMDCETCEFRKAGDQLSLEAEMTTDEGETSLAETIEDPTADVEEAFMLIDTMDAIHRELELLDPDSKRICKLIMEGKSERESAKILGLPWSTYRRRWEQIKADLYIKLKDYI